MESANAVLDELVARTEGLQPGRRLFHALNGVAFAWLIGWSGLDRTWLIASLTAVLTALLLVDLCRLWMPRWNVLFYRVFLPLASPRERTRLASSTWYVAGVLCCATAFPAHVAGPSVLVLALADPAASFVGRIWGRQRLGSGTLRGSAAFFATAAVTLVWFVPAPSAVGAAAVVTLIEALPWPLDDNLTISLATAAALTLLGT